MTFPTKQFLKAFSVVFFLMMAFTTESFAQKKEPKIKMFFGRGLQFVAGDSLFTLAINGRIQVMFESNSNLTNKTTQNEFLLRRCRLNIQGIAFTPRLFYRIQLGFASTDMASSNKAEANNLVLRDAMLYYQATKWLRIGAGQTKLPGNRQRQVSSANLQLVERAIANNNFTLDRDKGIWIFTNFNIKTALVKTTFAIATGEGRIAANKNGKMSYGARVEFLPFGAFTNNGDYIEGDQEKEPKPKLSIAGVYNYNMGASRIMGQLGDYLYNNTTANIQYYGGDIMFKYKGLSIESEFYRRQSNIGVVTNTSDSTQRNGIVEGMTLQAQMGFFVTKKLEIAARYAQIFPDAKVAAIVPKQQEFVTGLSYYFFKHNLKIQSDVSYFIKGENQNIAYRLSSVLSF